MSGNPGPNTTTTSNLIQENVPQSDGHQMGASATALCGFWGATPVAQQKGANQALVVDTSGGTANAATGVTTITGTYNSTILANAFATVLAQTNAIQAALVAAGIIKGSA